MSVPLDDLATVAARAARAGGDLLASRFRDGRVPGEYKVDDVKTDADVAAEERVLAVLEDAYPDHATHGEESGRRGDAEHVWIIDPLDGTNNFAAGFPAFATAVCCLRDDEPVAGAVYEPLPDSLFRVTRGGGGTVAPAAVATDPDRAGEATPLSADSDVPLDGGTVSFVIGLPAVRDPDRSARADALADALDGECKRVLQSWSPCVDWGMLASGGSEAVVCYHPDPFEQYVGSLLAEESGAAVRADDDLGLYVAAADGAVADRLATVAREAVAE